MATNIRIFGSSPRIPLDSCSVAHTSGELGWESGHFGIFVETNAVGGPNTIIERCKCILPVPAATIAGARLYSSVACTYTAATGVWAPTGATFQAPASRSTNVASTLALTQAANTIYVGMAMDAAAAMGNTTAAANVELAPQPI